MHQSVYALTFSRFLSTTVALFMAALCAAAPASAQPSFVAFRDRPYYEPLLAETRPARTSILFPAWSKEFPDSAEKGTRFAWQITLGDELPAFAVSNQVSAGPTEKGKWGFGLWIPISFHVIEDFKDESAPIVDTDYRFGFMTKFQCGCIGDTKLGIRFVPWAHESTHLGDEYTIVAVKDPAFERINVSYEYWEYGVSFEGSGAFTDDDNWTLRTGGRQPWGPDGYYSDHLLGSDVPALTPSKKNFEPTFGAEYRFAEWHGRQTYVSAEARHSPVYNYHQTPENPEERQWSWNLQLGRAIPIGTTGTPLKQYFVQVYHGVNPYGQLRSQKSYWSAGFGWIFGM